MAHSIRPRSASALVLAVAAACGRPPPEPAQPAPPAPPAPPVSPAPAAAGPAAGDPGAAVDAAAAAITADVLRGQVARLASDELEGRGPTTRGDRAARAYLVEQLKAMGYAPGGAGGAWEQPFDVVGVTASMPEKWTFSRGRAQLALRWSEQYMAASGVQAARGSIRNAEVCSSATASRRPSTAGTTSTARPARQVLFS